MEQTGEGNLLEALLVQVWNANIGVQGDVAVKQYETNNYVTVRKWKGYLSEHNRNSRLLYMYDEGNGERAEITYAASKSNAVAYEILSLVTKMDELKAIPADSYKKIIAHKIKPSAPTGYNEVDVGFFDLTKAQQDVIVGLLNRPGISLGAFESFAGNKETAAKMFAAYTKMHSLGSADFLKKIIKDKEDIVANGPIDATEAEKLLLDYSLDFLQDFIAGKFTKEVVEYYSKQMSKMPIHVNSFQ